MPFDYKKYDKKCEEMTPDELQLQWNHYTRLITGAATSTTVSGLAVPLTGGLSAIGVAISAPMIHNARKKREIIDKHLSKHNEAHVTRKRDVLGAMTVSGTIGVVTLGVGSFGADAIVAEGTQHGIEAIIGNETAVKAATHVVGDGVALAIEHEHTEHLKDKAANKAHICRIKSLDEDAVSDVGSIKIEK